jgi:Ca2+-binding EF-hand superfamily protein
MRRNAEGERGTGERATADLDDRELAKLTRIYRAYDKDESGGVTFQEWVAMKNYELSADQEKREKGWFDQADSNGDGKVTLGEWIDWKASQ